MRESAIVGKIIKKVKEKYPRAYIVKLSDRYHRGLPDLMIHLHVVDTQYSTISRTLTYSLAFFVEVKAAKGRLSAIQAAEHEKIKRSGGMIIVAKCADDVLFVLEMMDAIP